MLNMMHSPGNHSVTQSSFADPCTPLAGGFDSGWILLPDAPSTPPLWNLTITDDSKRKFGDRTRFLHLFMSE